MLRDGEKTVPFSETMTDTRAPDPTTNIECRDMIEAVVRYIIANRCLTEALVLRLYYFDHLSMSEIGLALGFSESRVSQLHKAIIAILRSQFQNAA